MSLLRWVPAGLAAIAEGAWISVVAGFMDELVLRAPVLGLPAFAAVVALGVVLARTVGRAARPALRRRRRSVRTPPDPADRHRGRLARGLTSQPGVGRDAPRDHRHRRAGRRARLGAGRAGARARVRPGDRATDRRGTALRLDA